MPPRYALLNSSPFSNPEPRADSVWSPDAGWISLPPDPPGWPPIAFFALIVGYLIFLGAIIFLAIHLGNKYRKREEGACSCRNPDIEAADGSGYELIQRTSSDSDHDNTSSQLDLPSSATKTPDEGSNGKSDLPAPPPYSER
ncbi:hypothetical protein FRC04_008198 [Tulasnella sp. 424]|nr:hypothetical protein FRC04_008198 [Tulasnella sp. 424]